MGSIFFKIIEVKADRKNKEIERKYSKEDSYFDLKREAYCKEIKYLVYFKKVFNISSEQRVKNEKTNEKATKMYEEVKFTTVLIRLYSSDDVFYFFEALVDKYTRYAFVRD